MNGPLWSGFGKLSFNWLKGKHSLILPTFPSLDRGRCWRKTTLATSSILQCNTEKLEGPITHLSSNNALNIEEPRPKWRGMRGLCYSIRRLNRERCSNVLWSAGSTTQEKLPIPERKRKFDGIYDRRWDCGGGASLRLRIHERGRKEPGKVPYSLFRSPAISRKLALWSWSVPKLSSLTCSGASASAASSPTSRRISSGSNCSSSFIVSQPASYGFGISR